MIVYTEAPKGIQKNIRIHKQIQQRYQETKLTYINLFHFFTLTMKYQKLKKPLKIKPQNINYLGINITSKVKTYMLRTTKH